MQSVETNPYAPCLSCQFIPQGWLARYLIRVANEFDLWLFGTLAACVPWLVLRMHCLLYVSLQRVDQSFVIGLMFILLFWWATELSIGAKRASRIVLHYIVSIGIFSFASICFLGFYWFAYL